MLLHPEVFDFKDKDVSMYVSIDIETLGTDPETCDVIEFAAVIDNHIDPVGMLPTYHCYLPKDVYRGQPFAMAMHSKILHRIAVREPGFSYIPQNLLGENFSQWLVKNGVEKNENFYDPIELIVAGKNFPGFDQRFLRRIENFENNINVFRRILDPCTSFYRPKIDKKPPGLSECLKRAGIEKSVEHTAVADAIDVIHCLRFVYDKFGHL